MTLSPVGLRAAAKRCTRSNVGLGRASGLSRFDPGLVFSRVLLFVRHLVLVMDVVMLSPKFLSFHFVSYGAVDSIYRRQLYPPARGGLLGYSLA